MKSPTEVLHYIYMRGLVVNTKIILAWKLRNIRYIFSEPKGSETDTGNSYSSLPEASDVWQLKRPSTQQHLERELSAASVSLWASASSAGTVESGTRSFRDLGPLVLRSSFLTCEMKLISTGTNETLFQSGWSPRDICQPLSWWWLTVEAKRATEFAKPDAPTVRATHATSEGHQTKPKTIRNHFFLFFFF